MAKIPSKLLRTNVEEPFLGFIPSGQRVLARIILCREYWVTMKATGEKVETWEVMWEVVEGEWKGKRLIDQWWFMYNKRNALTRLYFILDQLDIEIPLDGNDLDVNPSDVMGRMCWLQTIQGKDFRTKKKVNKPEPWHGYQRVRDEAAVRAEEKKTPLRRAF